MSEDNPTDALARFMGEDEETSVRYTFAWTRRGVQEGSDEEPPF